MRFDAYAIKTYPAKNARKIRDADAVELTLEHSRQLRISFRSRAKYSSCKTEGGAFVSQPRGQLAGRSKQAVKRPQRLIRVRNIAKTIDRGDGIKFGFRKPASSSFHLHRTSSPLALTILAAISLGSNPRSDHPASRANTVKSMKPDPKPRRVPTFVRLLRPARILPYSGPLFYCIRLPPSGSDHPRRLWTNSQ